MADKCIENTCHYFNIHLLAPWIGKILLKTNSKKNPFGAFWHLDVAKLTHWCSTWASEWRTKGVIKWFWMWKSGLRKRYFTNCFCGGKCLISVRGQRSELAHWLATTEREQSLKEPLTFTEVRQPSPKAQHVQPLRVLQVFLRWKGQSCTLSLAWLLIHSTAARK